MPNPHIRPLPDELAGFRLHMRAAHNHAERTAVSYLSHVKQFHYHLLDNDLATLTTATVEHVRGWLEAQHEKGIGADARRLSIFALRVYYDWQPASGPHANPARQVAPPAQNQLRTDYYTETQIQTILSVTAADDSLSGKFNHMLVATLAYTGVRCAEVVAIQTSDVDLPARALYIHGKGAKERTVPIPKPYVDLLNHYLSDIRPDLPASSYLLANPRSQTNGQQVGRISKEAVHYTIRAIGDTTGIPGRPPPPLATHLRHPPCPQRHLHRPYPTTPRTSAPEDNFAVSPFDTYRPHERNRHCLPLRTQPRKDVRSEPRSPDPPK